MIVVDREIRALLRQGEFRLDPFNDELVQASSVDLRLHPRARLIRPGPEPVDPRIELDISSVYEDVDLSPEGGYRLAARGYLLVQTLELMKLPALYQGQIAQRSSLVRLGLEVTSSLVNPGYEGRLPCIIKNLTDRPILIFAGVPFCQLVLHQCLGRPDVAYHEKEGAKYHGEEQARPSAISEDVQRWHRPAPQLVHPEQARELKVVVIPDDEET